MWNFNYLGEHTLITVGVNGYHYVYDPDDMGMGLHMLLHGCHEPWLAYVLEKVLMPGDCVVEVGSNIGYHSVLMADKIGPEGRLYCFDPNPEVQRFLRRNLLMNGFLDRAEIHQAAVLRGSMPGSVLHMYEGHFGGASVNRVIDHGWHKKLGEVEVESTSVDEFLAGRRMDVLRIDAEASDGEVIFGAAESLRSARAVTFEYEPRLGDASILDAFAMLKREGFTPFRSSQAHSLERYDGALEDSHPCDMVLWRQ